LLVNEDYSDGRDPAVTERFPALARELLDRGAALGGVGMEMHLHCDESGSASGYRFSPDRLAAAIAPYRELGLRVHGVRDFHIFGLTDNTSSWLQVGRPDADALTFDADYQPKPAYFAVRAVLKKRAGLA
jgi:GH35 family endo-1,4-beta-xylanase